MKEIIKAHYKDILLVLGYIIVAEMIYITLVDDLWHLWYINLLVGVGIFIIGIIGGYFYIKSVIKEKTKE